MNTPSKPIDDYYPVFSDRLYYNRGKKEDPQILPDNRTSVNVKGELTGTLPDANELLKFAAKHKLSEFQTLILLIKNAFEGHAYLYCNLTPEQLLTNGTLFIDWNNQKLVDLAQSFHLNLHEYMDGLHSCFEIFNEDKTDDPEFLDELIGFIISSRLFKLPVSLLSEISLKFLKKEPVLKLFYKDTAVSINQLVAEIALIETVNGLYTDAYSQLLQNIESKVNCLSILDVKLSLVHQPEIRNEEDLQKSFTEYLVQSRGNQSSHTAFGFLPEKQETQMKVLNTKIGKIYKILSKSCNEIFNSGAHSDNLILNDYFMQASKYYNSYSNSLCVQIINYFRIINLYFKVLNFRAYSSLSCNFESFLFIKEPWLTNTLLEKMDTELIQYRRQIEVEKHEQRTYFKIRNLADDEMTKFHKEFLLRKIKMLEIEIAKTERKIKKILNDK